MAKGLAASPHERQNILSIAVMLCSRLMQYLKLGGITCIKPLMQEFRKQRLFSEKPERLKPLKPLKYMVPSLGIEPRTRGFSVPCSTD